MTNGGMTPLMFAVESGDLNSVAACLNAQCNPFKFNVLNETVLDLAKKFPNVIENGESM